MPVTISVIGCSTWSRVFISRNQNRPSSSTRNSIVPALVYPTDVATAAAASVSCDAKRRRHDRRRRFLDDLLMAPLDRAFALDKRDHGAVLVAEQLHLDVTRPRQGAARDIWRSRRTQHPLPIARHESRSRDRRRSPTVRMPLPPPPATAFIRSGYPMRSAAATMSSSGSLEENGCSVPGTTGTPAVTCRTTRCGLAAHERDRLGCRTDECQPGFATRCRKLRVLGQKSVSRMHGVSARLPRGLEEAIDAEIALGRRVRPDRARPRPPCARDARFDRTRNRRRPTRSPDIAARTDHTHGDLAAVGDQNFAQNQTILHLREGASSTFDCSQSTGFRRYFRMVAVTSMVMAAVGYR